MDISDVSFNRLLDDVLSSDSEADTSKEFHQTDPYSGYCKTRDRKYHYQTFPTKRTDRKIIVVGASNVGKTSFVQRYLSGDFTGLHTWTAGGNVKTGRLF